MKAWTTGPGRRKDRRLRLRKMLFNLWVRRGLVVFTLICVFIDFVFNFNLLSISPPPPHPRSLFYAPEFLHFKASFISQPSPPPTPSVTLHVSANTNPSFLLILSPRCHQASLRCSIPLFPHISLCLCSQSPYMSSGDPIRHWASRGKEAHREKRVYVP